jgi:hypothetical protein
MQLIVHESSPQGGIVSIRVEHDGQKMVIPAGSYNSAAIIDRDKMFDEVNLFISTLSKDEQDRFWDIYCTILDLIGSDGFQSGLLIRGRLQKLVNEVYSIVTYPRLREFITRAKLKIPGNVSEVFEEFNERGRNYRIRTYILSDYLDMVAMALGLRFMIPIWGTYTQSLSEYSGNAYKESEAVKLIEVAGVDEWPPYKRMLDFIEASIEKDANTAAVVAGLSSEEIPRFLMAMALVRKISVGPLSTSSDDDSMARILFNYVTGTHRRMEGRFQSVTGVLQAKRKRITDNSDEDNSSVWDNYNQSTEITESDRQLIESYAAQYGLTVQVMAPDLKISRVEQCIALCSRDETRRIEPFQKALMFWVCRTISPEARDLIQKMVLLKMMGTTQAILDHWGYHELALMVSVEEYIEEGDEIIIPNETRNKITKQQLDILNADYPYYRQGTKRNDPSKRNNVAVAAIDQVVEQMSGRVWKAHAPRDIIDKNPMHRQLGYMCVSGDIKRQLADMIIHVNKVMRGSV